MKLGIVATTFTLISCLIGPLVNLPYCLLVTGMTNGIILICAGYLLSFLATTCLIKSSDNCPYICESYYELGYAVMGRASIYFNAVVFIFTACGYQIIYYMIVASTFASVN